MENLKLKLSIKCLLFTVVSVLIDQITKGIAITYATKHIVVNRFLDFMLVYNRGISFGLLSKYNVSSILVGLTIILIVSVCYIMFRSVNANEKVAYAFFIGGAIGNLVDRCRYGYVIDFIDIHVLQWHFPTFNLADVLLSLSCLILIVSAVKLK